MFLRALTGPAESSNAGRGSWMEVSINGQIYTVAPEQTLGVLLQELQLDQRHLAVAINGEIVRHSERTTRRLQTGDVIELIQAVGGG